MDQRVVVICVCTIEESGSFHKTELLIESLQLQDWEPRRKMLLLVTLAYGCLLSLLDPFLWLAHPGWSWAGVREPTGS